MEDVATKMIYVLIGRSNQKSYVYSAHPTHESAIEKGRKLMDELEVEQMLTMYIEEIPYYE